MSQSVLLRPRRALSPAQELIWTSQRLEPESPHQNMALLTRFDSPIDPDRFLNAVDAVVARSDALRTIITVIDGVPHPVLSQDPPVACKVARVDDADLDVWARNRISEPLDTSVSTYDAVLIDRGEDRWAWFMNVHHIATDASSSAVLFNAIARAYAGGDVELPTYGETVSELLASAKPERIERANLHWAGQPEAHPTQLYGGNLRSTTAAARVWIDMAGDRQNRFDNLLSQKQFSLISAELSRAVVLALLTSSYLARLGNETVTIGVPIHHRSTKLAKGVIGPLVELFPLRVSVQANDTFTSLHSKIGREFFGLLSNALPGTSPRQDFDVVLNVQTATMGDFGSIGANTSWIHPGHIDPHHQLRVQALDYDGSGVLELALDVNHRAGEPAQRQNAAAHFATVFDALLDDPEQLIHSVALPSNQELAQLSAFSSPKAGTPLKAPVASLVERSLTSAGANPAIRNGDAEVLSGGEVNVGVEAVARSLEAAGIGPGHLVGVEIGPSVEAVLAIHGIVRAGAAFVPIDPAYPAERRDYLRTDSGCELVLTSLDDLDELPRTIGEPSRSVPSLDDTAYVIYTSGSTGLPKGVPITYRGLSEYLGFAAGAYVGGTPPTMPLFTSLSFDLTITTLFLPLLTGGLMTIHPSGGLAALRQIVDQDVVTLMKATPSHLELLSAMLGQQDSSLSKLNAVIVGGEAFMVDLADRFLDNCEQPVSLFNEYGPTEAVVGCMIHEYDPVADTQPEVPIGGPAPGVVLHVLDAHLNRVPIGVAGELFITRPGMTSGYLGLSELNAERFVQLGESVGVVEGTVAYRTGDLVRLNDAQTMVYLGRIDEQIKVGGIRLEPGEIEYAARTVNGVRNAVARLWSPTEQQSHHCVRCGLPSNVPGVEFDDDGVCSSCHQFDLVAPQAESWFKTEEDLRSLLQDAKERSEGDYDVVHLISGGKDSTFALYKLVELGARVFAITLDNGYLADEAIANVKRATAALGVDYEIVSVDGIDEIFKDSLERFSNVCNGCYKAIYTVALAKAEELGVRAIVTGLSRGQFFETRLVPGMFGAERFDPDAIDEMVRAARRAYHSTPDAVSEQMDVDFLSDGTIFDRIEFIDLYRYVDVPLSELYETLDKTNTWKRPPDSGRSTNCLINAAGIYVHKLEQRHHNYAVPYAWDVRLGHKTRAEAMFELDDPMDDRELASITTMLGKVGYEPKKREMLTLWIEADQSIDLDEVRGVLRAALPAHSVPRVIEVVSEIPLTTNGKVDVEALPDPSTWRTTEIKGRAIDGETEEQIAAIWSAVLSLVNVGATDDFFDLGGTSLHALEMIIRVSSHFGVLIPEPVAFHKRTIGELAEHVDELLSSTADRSVGVALDIPPLVNDGPLPLSAGEEAMLYEWRRDPDDRRYNVARLYSLDSEYDRERLNQAIAAVVEHQPTLRTSYGVNRRELSVAAALHIGQASTQTADLTSLAGRLNDSTFDLVNGPLITVHHLQSNNLQSNSGEEHGLLLRTHHIVSDAGSLDVLWNQIELRYRGEPLPQLAASYAEHAVWQADRRSAPERLWSIDKPPSELSLRGDTEEADGYVHRQAPVSASALRSAPAPTLFGNALGALGAAVRAAHNGSRMEITATASLRDHPAMANVVGYFLNPLPLVIVADFDDSLEAVARRTGDTLAAALEHRAVPWQSVVASARERGITAPTGRVMLAIEDLAPASLGGRAVSHKILASGTAVNDLTFFVQIRDENVELGCEYRGSTVGRAKAAMLLDWFAIALESLVGEPTRTVRSLTTTPEPLRGPERENEGEPVPQLVETALSSMANAPAVRCGEQSLTYGELDVAARLLAARLRAVGVGRGDRVAICLPRSVDLLPAIWATWLLGASYVPIDVSQPAARVGLMVDNASISCAVTTTAQQVVFESLPTVLVDRPDSAVLPLVADPGVSSWPGSVEDEAYVIFTSGSTGEPKGVSITHVNLQSSVAARLQFYRTPVERYLLMSSAGFDSSVAGIYWALANGGELIIPTEDQVHDADALCDLVEACSVSHALMVPSMYGALLQRNSRALRSLRTVIVAGEACPPAIVDAHFCSLETADLINEYGPTEATVWATAHRCVASDAASPSVSIGGPIPGMTCHVLDSQNEPVGLHVAGELVLSGAGVSSGYLDGTDEAFFTMPSGEWAYRTGDLVVQRPGSSLDFLGRVDDQLSVGGVRIDPTEVEAAIGRIETVGACLVAVENRRLVAYVEPARIQRRRSLSALDIRTRAGDTLPATHVPSRVVVVEVLPRNVNGKLDRNALDSTALVVVEDGRRSAPKTATTDPLTSRINEVFSRVFDGAEVHGGSDFFDLGGDSLQAVAVVSMLESELGERVKIGELVDAPTPALLAAKLSAVEVGRQLHETAEDDLVEWLRRSGTQRPIILLPPGGGNLLRYGPFVRALDADVPVVGIRLPGADARSEIVDSIERQAEVMLAAIDSAVANGPYVLLGWSTGGLLAWEIGRLLADRGDSVEAIVLVDTVMAGLRIDDALSVKEKYQQLLKDDGVSAVVTEGAGRLIERASFALARRRYRSARAEGEAPSPVDAERQLGPVIRRAAFGYEPKRQDFPVVYISASESDREVTVDRWRELQDGAPFESFTVDGCHFIPEERCILGERKAPELVRELSLRL